MESTGFMFTPPRIALIILLIVLSPCLATGQSLKYQVSHEGKIIGTTTLTTKILPHSGEEIREITSRTKMRVKSLFFTVFSLDSEDTSLVDARGLLKHHSRSTIDGEEIIIHAERKETALAFQLTQDDQTHNWAIVLDHFDCSSVEWKQLEPMQPGESLVLNVLQLDNLEIEKQRFQRRENEPLVVDGQTVICRVFEWTGKTTRGRRWCLQNRLDIIIREDGTDEDGAYSFTLEKFSTQIYENPPTGERNNAR